MNKTAKGVLKIILFLGIGIILLYLVYLNFNSTYQLDCEKKGILPEDCNLIEQIIQNIRGANIVWIIIPLCFYMISNISRAMRWRMLIEPLGKKPKFLNALSTIMINYLVNLGIPRSGEFVRAGLLAKYEKLEPEKVIGTIVTSRMLDVICLLITIGLTLLFSFNTFVGYIREEINLGEKFGFLGSTNFLVGLGIGILLLFFSIWKWRTKLENSKIGQKIKKVGLGFWEGILSIRNLKNPVTFIFHTVVIWVCYYLMTYLMFFSFVPTASLAPVSGLVVFVFGTMGIVIPTPGGMGSYQFLISEALIIYGVPFAEAFSFANIMFFSVQFLNVILGLAAFIFLPIYNRNDKT